MANIDSHFHVWDPGVRRQGWIENIPTLFRRFDVTEIENIARSCGFDKGVLVQVLADVEETREFLAIAGESEFVAGVVGWIELSDPNIEEVILQLREDSGGEYLVGIRHLIQSEKDPEYLLRSQVLAGLRKLVDMGLRFDLLIRENQLPMAIKLASIVDDLAIVLDHGGKPSIGSGDSETWRKEITRLGRFDHVYCKLSGLVTEARGHITVEEISPYASHLIDSFGTNRLMFGSDWPVCTEVSSYPEVVALARGFLDDLSVTEQSDVFGGNAVRFYGLE